MIDKYYRLGYKAAIEDEKKDFLNEINEFFSDLSFEISDLSNEFQKLDINTLPEQADITDKFVYQAETYNTIREYIVTAKQLFDETTSLVYWLKQVHVNLEHIGYSGREYNNGRMEERNFLKDLSKDIPACLSALTDLMTEIDRLRTKTKSLKYTSNEKIVNKIELQTVIKKLDTELKALDTAFSVLKPYEVPDNDWLRVQRFGTDYAKKLNDIFQSSQEFFQQNKVLSDRMDSLIRAVGYIGWNSRDFSENQEKALQDTQAFVDVAIQMCQSVIAGTTA